MLQGSIRIFKVGPLVHYCFHYSAGQHAGCKFVLIMRIPIHSMSLPILLPPIASYLLLPNWQYFGSIAYEYCSRQAPLIWGSATSLMACYRSCHESNSLLVSSSKQFSCRELSGFTTSLVLVVFRVHRIQHFILSKTS